MKSHEPIIKTEYDDINNTLILDSDKGSDNGHFAMITQI